MTMVDQERVIERFSETADIYAGDAALMYDDLARTDDSEIDVLVRILRHVGAAAVLDLGCGSGRITLPLLAALPISCLALDRSAELLAILASRLMDDHSDRCHLVHADATRYRAARPVDSAVMGTSTISLFDAVERAALFDATRANLVAGGTFVLTNFCWTPGLSAGRPARQVGASGDIYVLDEVWISPNRRRVTVRSAATGHVGESEPWNLHHEELAAELSEADFAVKTILPLHESRAGRNSLIIAEAPR